MINENRQLLFDNFDGDNGVYTIAQLNELIRNIIRSNFPVPIWVCGEIQDLREKNGIRYFNLVEKHSEKNEIVAQITATLFFDSFRKISLKMKSVDEKFKLQENIEFKFLAYVDLYVKRGTYQLRIIDIDPVYTLGKVAAQRQKIIAELKKLGLLEKNRSLHLPGLPLNIGLITAFDSAAYHDFINELRLSGYGFKVFHYDCHMQGKYVEEDVLKALDFFNSLDKTKIDVIIITRGGGSTADLSWFDNQKIAVAIAQAKFPVISALGHQINTTVTDLVSHTSLKTPTKAAQYLIDLVNKAEEELINIQEFLKEKVLIALGEKRRNLEIQSLRLQHLTTNYFRSHRDFLIEKFSQLRQGAIYNLKNNRRILQDEFNKLQLLLNHIFIYLKQKSSEWEEKINMLNPYNLLKRGYTISYVDKRVIKSINQLKIRDKLRTLFYDGEVFSEIEKIEGESYE